MVENSDPKSHEGGVSRRGLGVLAAGAAAAVVGIATTEAQQNRLPPKLTPEEREIVERLVRRDELGRIVTFHKVSRQDVLALSPRHPTNADGSNPHPSWCCGVADCRFAEWKEVREGGLEGYAVGIHLQQNKPIFAFFKGEPNLRHDEVPKHLANEAQACITENPVVGGKEQLGNPYCLYIPRLG